MSRLYLSRALPILFIFHQTFSFAEVSHPSGFALEFGGEPFDFAYLADGGGIGLAGANHFTVEFWVRYRSDWSVTVVRCGQFSVGLINMSDEVWNYTADSLYHNDVVFRIAGLNETKELRTRGYPLTYNRWTHVASVWDGAEMSIYLDGVHSVTAAFAGPVAGSTATLSLGDFLFSGHIDELRIWRSARTQQQIQTKMNTALTGHEEGLAGYWNFNEGSGQAAIDSSSSGYVLRLGW